MTFYDYKVRRRSGEELDLGELQGKVVLVVNTATGCGFTPQYEAIEQLYEKYHDAGFEVLDFPCNQFGHQAPGDDEEIHAFCTGRYKTQFDQMAKVEVNGENELPLYTFLKSCKGEDEVNGLKGKMTMKAIEKISVSTKKPGDIRWNFTKFLVDRQGNVVRRYAPTYDPAAIEKDIAQLL
ncbi:MAG: glutathione peroxidase [Oscillospiraceae bacterium]|nr:glutathione peroxidase [Oscillospiraceae bacterium]